jgi:DNA-binding IclR family transcriptional regulator
MPPKVNSLIRAAEILKVLGKGLNQSSVIADTIHLSRSTTHRLLNTLVITGFATQDPVTRKYHLGPLIQSLAGNPLVVHQGLIQCAIAEMKRLNDTHMENVMLQVRQGAHRIIIEELRGDYLDPYLWGKGMSAPIHTGAAGKLLLAEMDTSQLNILFEKIKLFPVGPCTITDKAAMVAELNEIRKAGYAVSESEHHEGAYAMAVPIKNYLCPVAMAMAGHVSRLKERTESIVADLKKSAARISVNLKSNYDRS